MTPHDPPSPAQVGSLWVAGSFCFALLVNLLPWGRTLGIPDMIALLLVFWTFHAPGRAGLSVAFLLGLVMDVHSAAPLGDHTLLYVLLTVVAGALRARLIGLAPPMMILPLLPMLLLVQVVVLAVRQALGAPLPGWGLFLQWLSTALLWPVADLILLAPRRRMMQRRNLH